MSHTPINHHPNSQIKKALEEGKLKHRWVNQSDGGVREVVCPIEDETIDQIYFIENLITKYMKPYGFDFGTLLSEDEVSTNCGKWEISIKHKRHTKVKYKLLDTFEDLIIHIMVTVRKRSPKRYKKLISWMKETMPNIFEKDFFTKEAN